MSAYNAPSFIVTIYNPAYFASNTANLTQSQANALYLQKTTADTATALETFSSGIATNSLATTSAASTLDIASTSTGVINIGVLGGRSQIIHIGDGNSNVAGGAVHINNGTSTASNVQILNGAGSTGTITLGSTTSTLTVNSPLTWGYSTLPSFSSTSMIGYIYSPSYSGSGFGSGNDVTYFSQSVSVQGIYLITGFLAVSFTTGSTLTKASARITTGSVGGTPIASNSTIPSSTAVVTATQIQYQNLSVIYSLSTTTTFYFTMNYTYTSGTASAATDSTFKIIRIA